MTTPPATRKFSAWINLQPGSEPKLIVVGEIQINAGNPNPQLSRVNPQGIVPEILLLKLHIDNSGGAENQDMIFHPVRYEEAASKGKFSTVEIHWEGQCILSLPVTEAH